MIRANSQKQLRPSGVKIPFGATLDESNRWVILAQLIPWDEMAEPYMACFHATQGRPAKEARLVIAAVIRGKQNKAAEFGAKLSVSLAAEGIACVDECRWNAFHEGGDLISQVECYLERHGYYPEKVLADPLYGTRENRRYLKEKGIHYAGKPLGRPKKETQENKAELKAAKKQGHQDYVQRIPIEGKFGQGKNGYGLSRIKAKTAKTSTAWINSIFMVMNLLVLLRHFLPSTVIYGLLLQIKLQMSLYYSDMSYRSVKI